MELIVKYVKRKIFKKFWLNNIGLFKTQLINVHFYHVKMEETVHKQLPAIIVHVHNFMEDLLANLVRKDIFSNENIIIYKVIICLRC
jgi:hypothetical protein